MIVWASAVAAIAAGVAVADACHPVLPDLSGGHDAAARAPSPADDAAPTEDATSGGEDDVVSGDDDASDLLDAGPRDAGPGDEPCWTSFDAAVFYSTWPSSPSELAIQASPDGSCDYPDVTNPDTCPATQAEAGALWRTPCATPGLVCTYPGGGVRVYANGCSSMAQSWCELTRFRDGTCHAAWNGNGAGGSDGGSVGDGATE